MHSQPCGTRVAVLAPQPCGQDCEALARAVDAVDLSPWKPGPVSLHTTAATLQGDRQRDDALLRQGMDDAFDGPLRPCAVAPRLHVDAKAAASWQQTTVVASAQDDEALLRAAMDAAESPPASSWQPTTMVASHAQDDEALLRAAMDAAESPPAFWQPTNVSTESPSTAPSEPRSMGYLSLPDGAAAGLLPAMPGTVGFDELGVVRLA